MAMRYPGAEPIPSVVMTPGGGFIIYDGEYDPNSITAARAEEAGNYWDLSGSVDPDDTLYVFSGWYDKITGRGRIPQPPDRVSEASLALEVFAKRVQDVNLSGHKGRQSPYAVVENKSVDPFTSITASIEKGFLSVGRFTPRRPLVVSTSEAHACQLGIIAEQALALEPGSFLRLRDSGPESGPMTREKERTLLAMTRLAFADIGETGGAEPGNLHHTKAAAEAFEVMSEMPPDSLERALARPSLWEVVEVSQLRY